MADKYSSVYEQYDMNIVSTSKGRGASIVETDKGTYILKALDVGAKRVNAEYIFKEKLFEKGFTKIDRCQPNLEGELISYDSYAKPYVLRTHHAGRECNPVSLPDILSAVDNLAAFHKAGREIFEELDQDITIRNDFDFARKNRELKRVRNFMGKRSPKQRFEEIYLKVYDEFYKKAADCKNFDDEPGSNPRIGYCHGSYNNHSVIFCKSNDEEYLATISFDRFYVGNQLGDLYYFTRKMVEKNDYSFELFEKIINRYNEHIALSERDYMYIYRMYCYPEKFYKLSNQYMNGAKTWISPKMLEKLDKIIQDEAKKVELLLKIRKIFLHI